MVKLLLNFLNPPFRLFYPISTPVNKSQQTFFIILHHGLYRIRIMINHPLLTYDFLTVVPSEPHGFKTKWSLTPSQVLGWLRIHGQKYWDMIRSRRDHMSNLGLGEVRYPLIVCTTSIETTTDRVRMLSFIGPCKRKPSKTQIAQVTSF
ncbi:hypothetical protein ABFS83_07G090800 [Erythranthe nasuta]